MTPAQPHFDPPGPSDDFARRPAQAELFRAGWSAIVDHWLTQASKRAPLFYNPAHDTDGQAASAPVPWDGFPRLLSRWYEDRPDRDRKRWQAADTLRPLRPGGRPLRRIEGGTLTDDVFVQHRQQDEYCEWFVSRDGPETIRHVSFTAEGPEYWQFLANGTRLFFEQDDPRADLVAGDLTLVGDLYRQHIDPAVQDDDLVWPFDVAAWNPSKQRWDPFAEKGDYNPFNRWNTSLGAMHLTHPSNTLSAEISLASDATITRGDSNGKLITDSDDLICCSGYGNPNRSSDPLIGASVNQFARQGLSVTLADPIGLYIANLDSSLFSGPNGEDVSKAWQVDRGNEASERILRARFQVPTELGFTVEQVRAQSTSINFGGQIADGIQMTLVAQAKQLIQQPPSARACEKKCFIHPQKPAISRVTSLPADCGRVDWTALEPLLEAAAPPSKEVRPRAALAPELVSDRSPLLGSLKSRDDT